MLPPNPDLMASPADPDAPATPASSSPPPTPCQPCEDAGTVVLTPTEHRSEAVSLHVPVGARSASLAIIALCACLAVLHWAAAVFIPIATSALLICALSPVVGWLNRHRVPRSIAAAALLLALSGGLAGTVYQLSDGASQVVDSLPKAASKVRDKMRERARQPSPIETVQKAASQIEQAAAETSAPSVARRGVQRVQIERSPLDIRDYLWSGTMGLMSVLGQLTIVLFLTFFALAAGDTFRLKLMRIAGRSLARRKVTLQVIDEINGQVQRYLLVQLATSAIVGLATGLVYAILGLENAAVWGVIAAVLNLAPYIGSLAVTGASALVAFLQFGTLDMAFAVGGASLVIHTLVGSLLTPWLTSRASSLSPVAVFVSVLAWGWLWGLWGLLLGIPIMMAVKAVCDRVEDLHAVGELLGS
ncbi:AI-2E family transporter [Simplicispira hankyongi]|uniref:AI-2E family transporter n=1 Tax=Simplicispira hankyongi TaxID=2315688 RepID=A0A398CAX2_9BURK|nr:AI-2E family transporter [Simplicispira hankyongi]RID98048.1 AI-2E family transporter [Simplicispira hankyongi]